MRTYKLYTVILSALLSVPTFCQLNQAVSEKLSRYLEIQQKRIGFNGVVLVGEKDKVIYSATIGKASFELNVPVTLHSVFRIASLSKQFTGFLIAMAINERKLKSTDSLVKFFPNLTEPQWRNITIHQLLTHTSGIPHNEGIVDYWAVKSLMPLSKEQALKEIFAMKLRSEADFKYSSPGYFLLACIVERIYEMNYTDLLEKNITGPFQLASIGVYSTRKVIAQLTSGYHLLADSLIPAPYRDYSLMKGSGDLYSSASDLLKWNSVILKNQNLEKMLFADYGDTKLENGHYAFGWYIRDSTQNKKTAYYHGGGSFGTSAISVMYPLEGISIILLANVSILPVDELWSDIEKILFEKSFEFPELNSYISVDSNSLKKLVGRYICRSNTPELMIFVNNNQLYGKLGTNPPFELYPTASLTFYGKKVNAKFTFTLNEEGEATGLIAEVRGETLQFTKQ